MKQRKIMSLLLTAALVASTLAGCGSGADAPASGDTKADAPASGDTKAEEPAAGEDDTVDTSEYVELRMYAVADSSNNEQLNAQCWEQINSILKEKLNCTIKYENAEGQNGGDLYQLALAAKEPYDLMMATAGYDYTNAARRGAYMDLTELMPKCAPELYGLISPERWEEAKVDGKIYGIPNLAETYMSYAIMYREDLRKKYNCDPVTDLDSLGAYLQAIVDNEPEMFPSDDQAGKFMRRIYQYTHGLKDLDGNSNFMIDPDDPRTVINVYEEPDYIEYLQLCRDWYEKGYWPSDVLTTMEWGVNAVLNGKAAASFLQQFPGYSWHAPYAEKNNPGWEIGFLQYCDLSPEGVITPLPATQNMLAVAQNAAHPERALMALELIQTDEELWNLCTYGMEGINYVLTEDGEVDTTQIDDDARADYFPYTLIANDKFTRKSVDEWSQYDAQFAVIEKHNLTGYPLNAFSPDTTGEIEPKYNAINQVLAEYGLPLQAGMVEDVEAGYADLVKRMQAAGIEEVRQYLEKQVNDYLDSIGY